MSDVLNLLTPWWPDVAAFLRMGRHGAYVWPAFGVCALALGLEWWALRRQAQRMRWSTESTPSARGADE